MTQHLREHADWLDEVVTATEEGFTLLTNALNELEGRVRVLEGEAPAPPAEQFLVGVNHSSARLNEFNFVRVFGRPDWAVEMFPQKQEYQLVSLKPTHVALAGNLIDDTVRAWIEDERELEDLRLALWHEPYDNMEAGLWGRFQSVLAGKAAQHGFIPVSVFTADVRDEYLNEARTEEVWLDPYDWSPADTPPYDLFDQSTRTGSNLVAGIKKLRYVGHKIGIGEFATRNKNSQAQWIHRQVRWFQNEGLIGAAYFDRRHTSKTGEINDWRLTTDGFEALKSYDQ